MDSWLRDVYLHAGAASAAVSMQLGCLGSLGAAWPSVTPVG